MAYLEAGQVKERIGAKAEKWDDDRIDALVSRYEACVERHLGCAYEERTSTEDYDTWTGTVVLAWPCATEVASATIDGDDYTVDDLARLRVTTTTSVVTGARRGAGTITYTHVHPDGPPQALLDGCVLYVQAKYREGQPGSKSPRVGEYQDDSGNTYSFTRTEPTGVPDADAAIAEVGSHRIPGIA